MEKEKNHILYLDDERPNLDSFLLNFRKEYEVHLAGDRDEAINILEKHPIKIFLTDQRMPDYTGIEVISQVAKKFPHVISIIVSGYADKEVLFKAINEVNLFWFIEKPWQKFEVQHILRKAIEKYDAEQEKIATNIKLKEALEKAKQSDRLKSEFLLNLSHEIRTPLNGIMGFSSLLSENLSENSKFHTYISIINQSGNQLTSVIEDMIMAANIQTGSIEENYQIIDVQNFFKELKDSFSEKSSQKSQIRLVIKEIEDTQNSIIEIDSKKLYEIFKQLLKNAFKFTDTGEIEFGIFDATKHIFFVKDSGIGISKEDQEVIFDFFRKGNHKEMKRLFGGNGLGLSIVKGLLNLVKGEIWIESEKDKGTTFYFTFPFNKVISNKDSELLKSGG